MANPYWYSVKVLTKLAPLAFFLLESCERPVRIDRVPSAEDIAKAEPCESFEQPVFECRDSGSCNSGTTVYWRESAYRSRMQCDINVQKTVAKCYFYYEIKRGSSDTTYDYSADFIISSKTNRWCLLKEY